MSSTLEDQVNQLMIAQSAGSTTAPQMMDPKLFAESQNDFGMPSIGGMLKISNGNVAVIGLGLVFSSSIGGMLSGFLPQSGKWATIIAGLLIMYLGKGKQMIRDIGTGVLLGGLANVFSGLGSSFGGILGGGMSEMPPMEEIKDTYGGGDGIYPVNPSRRVFQ